MSETNTPTPPGEGEPAPAPEPEVTPAPAPETPEQTPEQAAEAKSRGDRRFAELTAKLSAGQREQARLADENERLRRIAMQQPPAQETPEQRYQREIATIEAQAEARAEAKLLARRFHEEGNAQFSDWAQKTKDLIDMGADPGIANLLVNMPGGVRVTAALAEDPAALQRIAAMQTPEGRAVALGKYAATLEDTPGRTPVPARPVSNAPNPIRPVTGRAAPVFNEYAADAQSLVDKYMKDDMARRAKG